MAKIIKTVKEHLPALTFIGKRYTNADRDAHGSYGAKWGEWFQNGWFNTLEIPGSADEIENGYIGLMGCSENPDSFEYWIGCFLPFNTPAPEGFESVDIPEGDAGVCWIYGREDTGELFGEDMHNQCMAALKEHGIGCLREDFKGAEEKWWWFFERYNCPRFTTPDEKGNVILDYGFYVN